MTADILPKYIKLRAAAALLPRGRSGKKRHIKSVFRYTTVGLRGILLRSADVGGYKYTTVELIQEFIDALTAQAGGEPASTAPVRSARREAELARVEAELDKRMGG
jgi:hypothetical protein